MVQEDLGMNNAKIQFEGRTLSAEEIIQWLGEKRGFLKEKGILKKATEQAFAVNRPLTKIECELLVSEKVKEHA